MASPFAVFRKNQQTLLVLLFILAMFAFIILGNLSTQKLSLPLLGMLLGMIVMTAIGVAVKKPMQYSATGAITGLLMGYIAVWWGFDTPDDSIVIESKVIGTLDQLEVRQMMEKRHVANDFLSRAVLKALGENGQFAAQQYLFGLGGSVEQQAALAKILQKEAEKLGIAIGNEAVTAYIRAATQDKLSRADFQEVLSEMKLSENTLYGIIAEELTLKTAWELLAPLAPASTPAGLWENFKKMEVTQSLQVVAVPVEAFGEFIPKPSDAELQAFFEERKSTFRGTPKPEDFGFFQPRKIQLAYIEASYLDIEQMVAEVTDEEVEKYYEDNKDTLFLNRQVPDFSRGQLIEPSTNPDIPELKVDVPGKQDATKPAKEESKDGNVPPAPDDATPAPEKSDADPGTPEEKNSVPADPPQESSQLTPANSLQTVAILNQSEQTEEKTTEETPVKSDDKPETAPADPKAESDDAEKPAKKPAVPPAPDDPSKNVPPAPEEPVGEQPLVAEKPQPKYQPLDTALKDSIRDQILRDRTRAKQKELIDLVLNGEEGKQSDKFEGMINLSNEYFAIGTREFEGKFNKAEADAERLKFIKEKQAELKALATKYGLYYAETPLMDYQELTESGEHAIGSAIIGDDPASGSSQSVADKMFRGSPESVYEADQATSLDLNSAYAFWKTADVAAHVPKFEDEGIRAQVLEAWTEYKARDRAKKRAEELKTRLEKAEAPWSELLAEETVTGEKEGLILSTRTTSRFSWMRKQSVPSQFGFNMDRAELSTIAGIDNVGDDFMNQVFNEMHEGAVEAIPNFDKSVYYVVKILNRQPSDPAGWEAKREQFLKSDLFLFFSPYAQMTGAEQNQLVTDWMKSLMDSYDVNFKGSATP